MNDRVRRVTPGFVLLLVASCASASGRAPPAETRPDVAALELGTFVRARTARLVLDESWRREMRLEAISVERPAPDRVTARGSAVLTLRKLRVEASDSISVTFLPDRQDLLLDAVDVAFFRQERTYGSGTENLAALTIANDQVSFFQR